MNKKYISLIFAFVLLFSTSFASSYETRENSVVPKVDETKKVYDFADLFTNSEESLLYYEITDFISKSNLDMAVVTINNNPRYSAMKYADDFYDYNNFGIGATNDGLLFLIDMDTRELWISTTGTAQLMYDDNRIDRILDATELEISNKDYYGATSKFIEKSEDYYNLGIPSSNENATIDENGNYIYNSEVSDSDMIFPLLGVSIIIALIVVFIMKGRHKTIKKATTAWSYMHNPMITHKEDTFLTTFTNRTYSPISTSSSGGGSSTHRSSSGRSHGGGGRRF